MKITRLTNQKINTDRVNIFIDGKYALSLTKNQLLDKKLFINKELDEQFLNQLKKLSDEGLVRAKTIEWLFIRPRSAKELSLYLTKKRIDKLFANSLVTEMQLKKYQDDKIFCSWWVDQRLAKNMSLTKIKSELFSKGISKKIVQQTLDSKDINEYQNMVLFIKTKRLEHKYPNTLKLKKYLFSKGYSYDIISSYFNQQN